MSPAQILELLQLSHSRGLELFPGDQYPWEALSKLSDFISYLGPTLPVSEFEQIGEQIWVARDTELAANISISGPCIIDHETTLRPGAFIRGSVLVGQGCVVGNSTEIKNSLLCDKVQVPHFNYVGDSILSYRAHLGAGAITSNVKSDKTLVTVRTPEGGIATGRKKLGALVGAGAEVGCNCVLNPGTVLGAGAIVYPLSSVRGLVPAESIYKQQGEIIPRNKD